MRHKLITLLGIFLISHLLYADSVLSFDLPENYIKKDNKKRLLLTIQIPAKLTSSEEEQLKVKKVDTSYVELKPFKTIKKEIDFEMLNLLAKKGLITGSSYYLLKSKTLKTKYDFLNLINNIYIKIMKWDKAQLINLGVNGDDIVFIIDFVNKFRNELKSYPQINIKEFIEKLKLLKKKLKGGRGEVRVVEIQNNDDGSTLLYLSLSKE